MSSDEIFKGNKVALTCDCNGVPDPNYSWTKDGKPASNGKVLTVASAATNDNGEYQCLAYNVLGNVSSASYNLNVIGKVLLFVQLI